MKNISLSPISSQSIQITAGKEHERTSHEVVSSTNNIINNNNLQDEREKSVSESVFKLNPLEKAILKAESCKEPDKAKIDWGRS